MTLSLEATSYTLIEGDRAIVCISASGSIPDSYSIDFSVMSYDITAESTAGKMDAVDGEWYVNGVGLNLVVGGQNRQFFGLNKDIHVAVLVKPICSFM